MNTTNRNFEVETTYVDTDRGTRVVHPIGYATRDEAQKFVDRLYSDGHSGRHAVIEAEKSLEILPRESPDAVTFGFGSDRYPGTIIKRTAKTIVFQEDQAVRTDTNVQSESQTYTYVRDPNGATHRAYVNEKGGYYAKGAGHVHIGSRRKYWDPSF